MEATLEAVAVIGLGVLILLDVVLNLVVRASARRVFVTPAPAPAPAVDPAAAIAATLASFRWVLTRALAGPSPDAARAEALALACRLLSREGCAWLLCEPDGGLRVAAVCGSGLAASGLSVSATKGALAEALAGRRARHISGPAAAGELPVELTAGRAPSAVSVLPVLRGDRVHALLLAVDRREVPVPEEAPAQAALAVVELADLAAELWHCREALDTERRKFELTVDTAADGIVVLDRCGVILHANAPVEALSGVPVASLIGRSWCDICQVKTADGTRIQDRRFPFGRVAMEGARTGRLEFEMSTARGEVIRVAANCGVIRDRGGEILLGVVGLHDLAGQPKADPARTRLIQCAIEEVRSPLLTASNTLEMMLGERFGPLTVNQKRGLTTSIGHLRKVLLCNDTLTRAATDGRARDGAA